MDKLVVKKETNEESGNIPVQTNEYSIYDYLKNNPSILIAGVSAAIAIITFLARLITNINARKTLMFWNIDVNNITMDNSALLFQGLMSVFYMALIAAVVICIDSVYKSYVSVKKCKFVNKYIKKKFRKHKKTEEYKEFIQSYKKLRRLLNVKHFLKLVGIFVLTFIGTSLYIFYSSLENKYIEVAMLICSIIQFLLLLVLLKRKSYSINRKEIKSDCDNGDYKKYIMNEELCPMDNDRSIRKHFTNKNLFAFIAPIIVFCLYFCVCSMFLPAKNVSPDNVQIVSLNDQEYVVVYQDSEKFFLKEIEVVIDEGNRKQTLVVHTDKQVILTSDSIDMEIRKYDDIKVLDIGEVYK